MMSIHAHAIEKSRVDDKIQYVLRKSLDMVCVSDEDTLLAHLKDGWDIVGRYNNGVGEDAYKTTSESEIAVIKSFIEKELLGFEIKPASTVTVSFQEFFAPKSCTSEGLNVDIGFFNNIDGKFEHECFRFEEDKARGVKRLLTVLGMQQYKEAVIHLIERRRELLSRKG